MPVARGRFDLFVTLTTSPLLLYVVQSPAGSPFSNEPERMIVPSVRYHSQYPAIMSPDMRPRAHTLPSLW